MASLAQQRFGAAASDYATSEVHAKGASLARLVALTESEPHFRVLDVGTGAGHMALALAPHVAKVTATDITEPMLAETRKLAASRGIENVRTLHARAEDLPFPDMSFNLVVTRLAAHHFDDKERFACEAHRVLMPGGVIGIVDTIGPDTASVPGMSEQQRLAWSGKFEFFKKLADPSHKSCLGLLGWRALLEGAGFSVTHAEMLDKELVFGPWVKRMRSDERTSARLKELIAEEPLRSFLRPREEDGDLTFTLKEGVLVGKKRA